MKILIVEDEPGLREALTDLLKGEGHFVEAVGDGREAAERGVDPAFDLVLLDLMLPGMDGVEVCQRLRERRPELYILMLTARGQTKDREMAERYGASRFMTKPFSNDEVLTSVRELAGT